MGFYPHVTALSPKKLKEKGITLVLADLDNTLSAYQSEQPSEEIVQWKNGLHCEGISLFILSNSRKPTRVIDYAKQLDVPFLSASGKPGKKGFIKALEQMKCTVDETVMVGDQIFTDVLGATRMGITPILVKPIRLSGNPGRYIRYAIETPFRSAGRQRAFL